MLNARFTGSDQKTTLLFDLYSLLRKLLGGDNLPLPLNGKLSRFPDFLVRSSIIDSSFK